MLLRSFAAIAILTMFATLIPSCIDGKGDPIQVSITYEVQVFDNAVDRNPVPGKLVTVGVQKVLAGGSVEDADQVTIVSDVNGFVSFDVDYELLKKEQLEFSALTAGCNAGYCNPNEIVSHQQASIWADGANEVTMAIPEAGPDALFIAP